MQRLNGVDINLFVAFSALYRCRSVTRAAQELSLTQPAMSHKLRRLREALDDPLFVSSPQGLVPTPAADGLAPVVEQALGALEGALGSATFDPATAKRHFVLQMSDFAELTVLPTALSRIRAAGPGLSLEVVPPTPDTADALERGRVDLGFGAGMTLPSSARKTKISVHDFVVVARADHPRLDGGLTLERYVAADHVVVSPRGGTKTFVDEALEAHGHQRNIGCRIRRFVTAPFLVEASDMLFTAPRSLYAALKDKLRLTAYEVPFEIPVVTVWMFWHERVHADPAHVWLRQMALATSEALARGP